MKVAILQTPVSPDKGENLRVAALAVRRAAEAGAVLAVLPEMFCCPYDTALFQAYAEDRGGEAYAALSLMARKNRLTLVGGSLPERDGDRLYNTAFVFAPDGTEIARHRKAHLFDIAVTGGQQFQESAVFSPGAEATVFDCQGRRFGLGVCFDIRFPELSRRMVHLGAEALVFPAAFNMTTAPSTGSWPSAPGPWTTRCTPWAPPPPGRDGKLCVLRQFPGVRPLGPGHRPGRGRARRGLRGAGFRGGGPGAPGAAPAVFPPAGALLASAARFKNAGIFWNAARCVAQFGPEAKFHACGRRGSAEGFRSCNDALISFPAWTLPFPTAYY